jgi:hypothetical protein
VEEEPERSATGVFIHTHMRTDCLDFVELLERTQSSVYRVLRTALSRHVSDSQAFFISEIRPASSP